MPSINEIKKQIQSVKNTRKITKAMQLVAASKSRKFQKKAVSIRSFAFDLLYILHHNLKGIESNMYTDEKENGKVLFIVYSSDKGLCGALNQRLLKTLQNSSEWKNTSQDEKVIISIGKKASSFLKYYGYKPAHTFDGIKEELSEYDALEYVEKILDLWKKGDIKKVYMVSPHFKNAFTFYPLIKQFLPLSENILKAHIGVDADSFKKESDLVNSQFMIYEPTQEKVSDYLSEQLCQTLFLQAFYDLKASEYSSRMMAMQNATGAADNLIKEKTLSYNKARQAAITREIAEIVGASFV